MQGSNNQTGDNESIEIKNNTISKIENPTVIQPQCHFHFGTDSEFYQAPAPKISTEISSEKLVPPGKHVQEPNKDPVQPGETLKKLELIVGLHQQEANTDPASSLVSCWTELNTDEHLLNHVYCAGRRGP